VREFVVARNPEEGSSLPYLVRLPLPDGAVVLKARDVWPRTAKVYLMASWNADTRRNAGFDEAMVRAKTARAVEACNRQMFAVWRDEPLPTWGWPSEDPTPLPPNNDDAWSD
jgi:hypothetical protein